MAQLLENVDTDLVVSFLLLIRDCYPQVNEAVIFIESKTEVAATAAMANMRDAISHFATFLSGKLDKAQRLAQIASAEEHLRRALLEPYETAYKLRLVEVRDLYRLYKKHVLPAKASSDALKKAPSERSLDIRLAKVVDLGANGRRAKGKNLWTREWEQGVANLVKAYSEVSKIHTMLSGYWNVFVQSEPGLSVATHEEEIRKMKKRLADKDKQIAELQSKLRALA